MEVCTYELFLQKRALDQRAQTSRPFKTLVLICVTLSIEQRASQPVERNGLDLEISPAGKRDGTESFY